MLYICSSRSLPRLHFLWSPSEEQMESTSRLRRQRWQTKLHFLPQSARRGFNTVNMSGCSWEMACYRCNRDSINNPLPDSDINMCDAFGHSMIQLARVCASPFHTQLCKFQQIRTLKSEEQVGRCFQAQRLMLFTHCYTMTCPNRWYRSLLFHNALSEPAATAQRPLAPCLGKYAQVHSSVANRWYLLHCQVERSPFWLMWGCFFKKCFYPHWWLFIWILSVILVVHHFDPDPDFNTSTTPGLIAIMVVTVMGMNLNHFCDALTFSVAFPRGRHSCFSREMSSQLWDTYL